MLVHVSEFTAWRLAHSCDGHPKPPNLPFKLDHYGRTILHVADKVMKQIKEEYPDLDTDVAINHNQTDAWRLQHTQHIAS